MKRAVCALLLFFFSICFVIAKSKEGHDDDLHEVLFGKNYDEYERNDLINEDKIKKLDAACYLLLDYCKSKNNTAQGEKALRELGISNIFNITLKQMDTPGGPHHERFTHLGWDEKWYQGGKNAVKAFKFRRDSIMLESVHTKIFNDPFITRRQAELFAKFCYYVHIVGDHENNEAGTAKDLMMLVQRANAKKQETVIDELISICTELFMYQDSSILVGKLRIIRDNTRTIDDTKEPGKSQVREIAENVLDILKQYVPDLLRDWEPFVENFYSENYYQEDYYQEDLLAS